MLASHYQSVDESKKNFSPVRRGLKGDHVACFENGELRRRITPGQILGFLRALLHVESSGEDQGRAPNFNDATRRGFSLAPLRSIRRHMGARSLRAAAGSLPAKVLGTVRRAKRFRASMLSRKHEG